MKVVDRGKYVWYNGFKLEKEGTNMAKFKAFSGTVYHQVDDKGRVRIPSKFFLKDDGGEAAVKNDDKNYAMELYFMAGTSGCISVYEKEALEVRLQALMEIPNSSEKVVMAKRKIMGSVERVETDKQGRVVIPTPLRLYAKINRELVTVGNIDHFEIWAKEVYEPMDSEMSFKSAYSEVGFF